MKPARYTSPRLTFKRSVIEKLEPSERFQVVTANGTVEMTRAEFEREFSNVAASRSYLEAGNYSYASFPKRAMAYLVETGAPDEATPLPGTRYPFPTCLDGKCGEAAYRRWLAARAMAHVVRDRGRGNPEARRAAYKRAIHEAVERSGGRDAYTGEELDWSHLGTYNNDESKAGRREYKKKRALQPTVDHVTDGRGEPLFNLCGWRTNDSKSDLSYDELVEFCRKVVAFEKAARKNGIR
jgi:hypothetical protein